MMATSSEITPKQRLSLYSGDDWEEFILEWVLSLKEEGYTGVMRMGGANDSGADIAAFLTPQKTDGRWHCFQCKHYDAALGASKAYPEMLKIIAAVAAGKYKTLPERYVFVAPKVGASLKQALAKPEQLKAAFLAEFDKPSSRLGAEYSRDVLAAALDMARAMDFSCFEAATLDVILEQHAQTRYHAHRFRTSLPDRPDPDDPPAEHAEVEARYIQQLLEVYAEKWGCPVHSPSDARAHPRAGKHLRHQRVAFYCAEQLRVFARDSVPPQVFENLQKEIHSRVEQVADRDYDTGYDRLNAVTDAAVALRLRESILVHVVDHRDRTGICHQLANDGELAWCDKEEQP